jgi:hypothetical protein
MAVLSMTGQWAGQFCRRQNSLFGGSSNGGVWCREVENALSLNGD